YGGGAGEEALLGGEPRAAGELEVRGELAELSVDGNEVPGTDRLEHPSLLPPRRVAGDVEARLDAGVQHPGTGGEQGVDQHAHRALVARDGTRAQEHGVPALDAQPFLLRLEQLGQRRPRLALGAGGEDADVVRDEPL